MAQTGCRGCGGCGGCVVGVFVLGLLGVLIGASIWLVVNLGRMASSETAEGVVVDLIASTDSDGVTYAPVVEYEVNGVVYRLQSRVSYGGLAVPAIGDRRQVLYDPDDPADAVFRSFWTLWFLPILMIVVPLVILVLIGYFSVRTARRRARDAEMVNPSGVVFPYRPAPGEPIDIQPVETAGAGLPPGPEGVQIEADFMGAEPSPMDSDGKVRYRIKARGEVGSDVLRFFGPWMDEDPTLDLMAAGNKVTVVVDPVDPERYEVLFPFPND